MDQQLLSIRDFCQVTGIGETMAKKLVRENRVLSVKIGDRRLIPAKAVAAYVEQLISESEPVAA
jgi:excisionase family DNA binding protein